MQVAHRAGFKLLVLLIIKSNFYDNPISHAIHGICFIPLWIQVSVSIYIEIKYPHFE